jgi:hypothetical protein
MSFFVLHLEQREKPDQNQTVSRPKNGGGAKNRLNPNHPPRKIGGDVKDAFPEMNKTEHF